MDFDSLVRSLYPGWELLPAAKRRKTANKQNKPSNWFEKCTADQLKKLCKAALVPVSGTKAALVERLLTAELTRKFSHQHGVRRLDDICNETLKEDLRSKGLVVSGPRFDLVLRLFQHETSDKTGAEPKKAAGIFDETGKFQPKSRAKSMKLPDPAKLSERMRKTARPPDEVQWKWSDTKIKYHCDRCVKLAADIIQKEIIDKELFDRGEEQLAWTIVVNLIRWFIYPDGDMSAGRAFTYQYCPAGMGRTDIKDDLYPHLIKLLESTTDKSKLEEWKVGRLLRDLNKQGRAYLIEDGAFDNALKKYVPATSDEDDKPIKLTQYCSATGITSEYLVENY
jgi:hypothetical protein